MVNQRGGYEKVEISNGRKYLLESWEHSKCSGSRNIGNLFNDALINLLHGGRRFIA